MKTDTERARSSVQDLDLRVRERHLISGLLDPKVVERYLAELPDLEPQADSITIEQPALSGEGSGRSGQGAGGA